MKKFLFAFYVGLYAFVAGALVTIDVVSIKAGWPWLSTLVRPMGIVFLCVNIPLAFFAVVKIGHVVFLHSYQHHQNVMRSIREADMTSLPYSTTVRPQISVKDETLFHKAGTSGTLLQDVSSGTAEKRNVGDDCNVAVAYFLADNLGASIREVSRGTGYSIATINRTNAWKNRRK